MCLYLAAGKSRRFGDANKLLALLKGKPLVMHAADIVRALPLAHRIAIVSDDAVASQLAGFEIIHSSTAQNTMSNNIALGVKAAQAVGAEAVLIALADMPFVPYPHFAAVMAACTFTQASASSNGLMHMPPACFPANHFGQLLSLSGDNGAGKIISNLPRETIIMASKEALADIDYPMDLAAGLQNDKSVTGNITCK